MDKMLYVGMSGARTTQMAQQAAVNNLVNASTPGFRGDFFTTLSAQIQGPGLASRVNSVGGEMRSNLATGDIQHTGRELDVAVMGDGWLSVQAADGGEAYSRRGDLRVTETGLLVNGANQPVLGDNGPITLPASQKISIGGDGTVSVVPMGQAANTLMVAGRLKLVRLDPQLAVKGTDGLMRQSDGKPGQMAADLKVTSGSLESSNVNAVEAMVTMINLAREYEMQLKTMNTAKEAADSGTSLMKLA